jgi:hypothetical protein
MLEFTESRRSRLRSVFHSLQTKGHRRPNAAHTIRFLIVASLAMDLMAQFWMGTPASARGSESIGSRVPARAESSATPGKQASSAFTCSHGCFQFPFPLAVSASYQLLGGVATLTAYPGFDVTKTPYDIEIYDVTTGVRVGQPCPTGATCSRSVAYSYATTHTYIAYVALNGATNPPPAVQNNSNPVTIVWRNLLVLNGPEAVFNNAAANLTATSAIDVSFPYLYDIEIYDVTTGTRVAGCLSGTTCPVPVNYPTLCTPTTHTFIAYIAANSTTLPPPQIQATSNPLSVVFHGPHC